MEEGEGELPMKKQKLKNGRLYVHVFIHIHVHTQRVQSSWQLLQHNIFQVKRQRILAHGGKSEVKENIFFTVNAEHFEEYAAVRVLGLQAAIEMFVSSWWTCFCLAFRMSCQCLCFPFSFLAELLSWSKLQFYFWTFHSCKRLEDLQQISAKARGDWKQRARRDSRTNYRHLGDTPLKHQEATPLPLLAF